MARDKSVYWIGKKPMSRNRYSAKVRQLSHYLYNLAWMISFTLEIEPGARDFYGHERPERPHEYGARYRLERFPARFARQVGRPRQRLYDLESAYAEEVSRLPREEGAIWDAALCVGAVHSDEMFQDLDHDLRLNAGMTLEQAASEFPALMSQLRTIEPPSAAELPFRASDFSAGMLAGMFISERRRGIPEAEATGYTGDTNHHHLAYPRGIGELRELLATARAEDGAELGLVHPFAPNDGWMAWFRYILSRAQHRLDEKNAGLDLSVPMVTEPADSEPPDPPGLADKRYRYAARFVAAYEGAPITDTEQRPSLESYRFERAHSHMGITLDAFYLVRHQVRRLLADTRRDPHKLERYLGRASAGAGRDLGEALATAMSWYTPRRSYSFPGKLGLPAGDGEPGALTRLQVVPMNRWEVRFCFPELLELCSRLAHGSGGLSVAVESFIAAREPCRVSLPPVVGEMHELVNLLPSDRDLGYALAHLGADGSDGTAWRSALLQAAGTITAHIWDHDDILRGVGAAVDGR